MLLNYLGYALNYRTYYIWNKEHGRLCITVNQHHGRNCFFVGARFCGYVTRIREKKSKVAINAPQELRVFRLLQYSNLEYHNMLCLRESSAYPNKLLLDATWYRGIRRLFVKLLRKGKC